MNSPLITTMKIIVYRYDSSHVSVSKEVQEFFCDWFRHSESEEHQEQLPSTSTASVHELQLPRSAHVVLLILFILSILKVGDW
mmetsp:Transcript_3720/g.8147  ORF Transcript_3720/g.8147 Transcript_3720/m.8147 type:complete len:83 (+) Transcript_3720:943-1191(+)